MKVLQNQFPETQNPETKSETKVWENKRKRINEKRRQRRQKRKEENPDFLKKESAKHKEQIQKQKEENPEYVKIESAKRQERRQRYEKERLKQQHQNERTKMFNDLFDSYFEKYKDTFPTPVSRNLWEKLKKDEISFEFNIFGNETTIKELHEYRQKQIEFLKNNPYHPCAGSIIFYIKTFVHRPKDQRKLTDDELEWLFSLNLDVWRIEPEDSDKRDRREYYREMRKENYKKQKSNQKNHNLNLRFMKADPNRVLSLDEITNNPFVSNFSQREEFKINLWKQDKNPEYLEKWKKQRENYEKEVADLSIEYKNDFLKNQAK